MKEFETKIPKNCQIVPLYYTVHSSTNETIWFTEENTKVWRMPSYCSSRLINEMLQPTTTGIHLLIIRPSINNNRSIVFFSQSLNCFQFPIVFSIAPFGSSSLNTTPYYLHKLLMQRKMQLIFPAHCRKHQCIAIIYIQSRNKYCIFIDNSKFKIKRK